MAGKGTTYVVRPRSKKSAGPATKQGAPQRRRVGRGAVKIPKVRRGPPAKRRLTGRRIAVGLVIAAVAAGYWAHRAREARFEGAKDKAIEYFATRVRKADPSWLSLFGHMHRRFGLVVPLASGRRADDIDADVRRPEVFQIYRRIEDPMATVEKWEIAALPTAIDRITASALHCDRIPLPGDWIDVLRKGSAAGGYALTHSVLATEWSIENGCLTSSEVEGLHTDQIALLVTLVQRREELRDQFDAITDMWIEAIAMLYYSGAGGMVRPEWVEEIVRIQNDNGGWSRNPDDERSDPHVTALALWVLLEYMEPDIPRTPWIQQLG